MQLDLCLFLAFKDITMQKNRKCLNYPLIAIKWWTDSMKRPFYLLKPVYLIFFYQE